MKKQRLSLIITVIGCLLILLISACVHAPNRDRDDDNTDDDSEIIYYTTALERALAKALGKAPGEEITPAELATLTHLEIPSLDRSDPDLLPIGLDKDGIALLAHCVNLKVLDLSFNRITDISSLAGLTHLTELNLEVNPLIDADLTPLAGLTRLTKLNLSTIGISDLTPLAGLVNLQVLDLSSNRVKDLTVLANMIQLKELHLRGNQIHDVTPLANLIQIEKFYLDRNMIADLKPLVDNPGLGNKDPVHLEAGVEREADVVTLRGNPLSRISHIEYVFALKRRGVIVRW